MKKFLKMLLLMLLLVSLISGCSLLPQRLNDEPLEETPAPAPTPAPVPETKTTVEGIEALTADERYELNIFLSNFSEAMYDPIDGYYTGAEEKVNFVYTHAKINSPKNIEYLNGNAYMSEEYVNTIIKRFFGHTISYTDIKDAKDWIFMEGYYCIPAADGEFYGYFSIADSYIENPDGTYNVRFNVYANDHDREIIDKSVYYFTDAKASQTYTSTSHGEATLKKKMHNGKETYEIIYYDVY